MGSPNFAKPKYATGIAFIPVYDFSEEDINSVIEANDWDSDDLSLAESILVESESDYMEEQVDYCAQTLEQLKVIVDEALNGMLPNLKSMEDEKVDEWFVLNKSHGYNEGIGFVIEPREIIYSHGERYADAYWELACKNEEDAEKTSYDELSGFFNVVQSAYSYMMAATGFHYNLHYILGGWCNNTAKITEIPIPDKSIEGLKLVDAINAVLAQALEEA